MRAVRIFFNILYGIVIFMLIFDFGATLFLLNHGLAIEANPLVRNLTPYGAIIISLLAMVYLRKFSRWNFISVIVLFCWFFVVIANHLIIFFNADPTFILFN